MAFKFKLEKVLDYRKQLEEQAMQALAEARSAREAESRKLEELRLDLAAQMDRLQSSAQMDGAERWLVLSYSQALRADIAFSEMRLVRLDAAVAECQARLVEKAQERQLLDKLKDKQAARHAEEEKQKEQRDNDETATIRYGRQAF